MTYARARMRTWSRRLGLGLLASVATVALTATTASALKVHLRGHSTETGCQKNVKVGFDLYVKHHEFRLVRAFTAKNLKYPNLTPPIPRGHETGRCDPGPSVYEFLDFDSFLDAIDIDADRGIFSGASKFTSSGHTLEQWVLHGHVTSKRVKGHIQWKARGYLVYAQGEGGLEFGGASTGNVFWKASATS